MRYFDGNRVFGSQKDDLNCLLTSAQKIGIFSPYFHSHIMKYIKDVEGDGEKRPQFLESRWLVQCGSCC